MDYRPQSPDLSSYAPESPDLSGFTENSALPSPRFGHQHSLSRDRFGGPYTQNAFPYSGSPTSQPLQQLQPLYHQQQQPPPPFDMAPSRRVKNEYDADDDVLPDAPAPSKRQRKSHQSLPALAPGGSSFDGQHSQLTAPLQGMSTQPKDPTHGVQLKTSFPVARIKRLMQADEDIGKVAQVTPQVVSRALELFMIKLISASSEQARGGAQGGKPQKKILAQHMKKAMTSDDTFDFLADIISKVPDAPPKAKKEANSDSEEGVGKTAKKKGKKRKGSGEDLDE